MKLEQQIETVTELLNKDEERFRKNQQADQTNFEDKLDSLQMTVAGFSSHNDIKRAQEVSVETRRVVKQVR